MGGNESLPVKKNVENLTLPQLKPSIVDFTASKGKPIICSGWVANECCSQWSPQNVFYSNEVLIPAPGPDQVRVKMYAAGINPVDAQRTTFKSAPPDAQNPSRHPLPSFAFPYVCGIEGSGIVESVGWKSDDTAAPYSLQVGDRVTFLADMTKNIGGTFCQYANVDASVVCKLPELEQVGSPLIDMVEAAALPAAAGTAYIALFDKLRIEKGKSIFISGATGGVGSVAVQLAHFFGLQVFASCSSSNLKYAQELGADVAIDYASGDVVKRILKETSDYGVDYVLECANATLAENHSQVLRYGGAICVITGLLQPSCDLVFRRQISIHYIFTGLMYTIRDARAQLQPLCAALVQMHLQQAFHVDVEEVPLQRVGEALSVIALGHGKGKLVVTGFHEKEAAEEYARRMLVKHYNSALEFH